MKRPCTLLAALVAIMIGGCASVPASAPATIAARPSPQAALSRPAHPASAAPAHAAVAAAPRTKAQLQATFGDTRVVRFDSGYEVWLYRLIDTPGAQPQLRPWRSPQDERDGAAEFVVLVAPSGDVLKTRERRPPARR